MTTTIKLILGTKTVRLVLHKYPNRLAYLSERGRIRARAHFYGQFKRRGYLGSIHYVAGDLEALMHEVFHAANHAVRLGLVKSHSCSRKCHEERVAVALGRISVAVLRGVSLDSSVV